MRYGIKSVTMDDVAKELGISKKTLYQHIDNKTDLIERIIHQHIVDETGCLSDIANSAQDSIEQILLIARHVVQLLRGMRPTTMFDLKKYYHNCWRKLDAFHLDYVYNVIRTNLDLGVTQGVYRNDMNTDIVAKLYVGMTMLLPNEEIFPMRDYNRDQLFIEYINYHLRGILSERGLEKLESYQPII